MLNAEKYRDKILEFINKKGTMYFSFKKDNVNMFEQCCETNCDYCSLYSENSTKEPCTIKRIKWLLSEYKEPVRLTKLEYDILKYISDNTKYLYITRDDCNGLFLYGIEPTKDDGCWYGKYYAGMAAFSKLFQFVKWEDSEPTSIKDILKNCEVIEDANY